MELEVHWTGEGEQPVGRLYQDARGTIFFEYAESWRSGGWELSPLYLPSRSKKNFSSPRTHFALIRAQHSFSVSRQ